MSKVRMSKARIPSQRGGPAAHVLDLGGGSAPVVLVMPHRRSLASRLALAAARELWERRFAWAPLWAGVGLFVAAAVLSLVLPGAALALALPALLLPAGWALIGRRHPRWSVRRTARDQFPSIAVTAGVLAWSAAATWFGPGRVLTVLWAVGTAAAQAAWSYRRTKTPTPAPAADPTAQN
ncbi:hypothetical protein ACFV1L_25630 [Kitasatospora sp. NPDC059646]|uniref:hypothetical protein n=1 Tax=Kitasatospora sp. NPDC059646 TaxID=3346893 RepID=UPI0036D082E7